MIARRLVCCALLLMATCGFNLHAEDNPQQKFVASPRSGAGTQGRAEISFDHGIHRLDLPPLAVVELVGLTFEAMVHVAAVAAQGRPAARSAGIGRDD